MKIVVAGGSGFLGKSLQKHWEEQGHRVVHLSSKPISKNDVFWDGLTLGAWLHVLEDASVLVNLSGNTRKATEARIYFRISSDSKGN
jgi:NAD dependent epimerase/dehydratase family enzyme